MLASFALVLGIAAAAGAPSQALAPSLTADLDGSGGAVTVTALPARGVARLQVRDAKGKKIAEAKAPAPDADVVHVTLTSGPLGSVGSLLEVSASTDASECLSVWRYRDAGLAKLPIRSANGKDLPDCGRPGQWSYRWEREGEGRPSVLTRVRTEKVEQGVLRVKEAFAFAGFSLDYATALSACEINGVPIPSWYGATLYTRPALETLYGRFGLASMKGEPTLAIHADRERGVFVLRFAGPEGEIAAPVEAYAARSGTATLAARAGGETAHVSVRLAGDGSVPYEARVEGLGPRFDRVYAPAGSWRGGSRQVFPGAADELASEDLAGVWGNSQGKSTTISIEGAPPFRVRIGASLFEIDLEGARAPVDALLLPVDAAERPWGLVLRGPNTLDRVPFVCAGEGAGRECRADGGAETLRRIGARVNVR